MITGAAAVWCLSVLLLFGCSSPMDDALETGARATRPEEETEILSTEAEQSRQKEMEDLAALRIGNFEKRELLKKLEPDLLEDFIHLYTCTRQFEEKCKLPVPLERDQAVLLMTLLHTECPELYQYDVTTNYGMDLVEEKVIAITVPYGMDQAGYEERMKYCRARIDDFTEQAEKLESRYEQEALIYRLFSQLVTYDIDAPRSSDASGILVEGQGKCDGISLAFKWVMEELEIPCIVVPGDSRRPEENPLGHAWNLVKPGENWRVVDVTQDSSRESRENLMYPVFNSEDSWLYQDYQVPEAVWSLGIPECSGMEESYHVLNKSYFTGTSAKDGFIATLERAYAEGGSAPVQFESKEAWADFKENSDLWTDQWMEETGIFGAVSYTSIDTFQVTLVNLDINQYSSPMKTLEEQILEMQGRIEEKKAKLDEEAKELEAMQGELLALKAEAEALVSNGTESMEEAEIDRYNSLVSEYNALLAEYQTRAAGYDKRLVNYDLYKEEYNSYVRLFNEMSAQD